MPRVSANNSLFLPAEYQSPFTRFYFSLSHIDRPRASRIRVPCHIEHGLYDVCQVFRWPGRAECLYVDIWALPDRLTFPRYCSVCSLCKNRIILCAISITECSANESSITVCHSNDIHSTCSDRRFIITRNKPTTYTREIRGFFQANHEEEQC